MRTGMNATHFLEDVPVPAGQLLEIVADGLETIVNIFFIGIAT
jgi:alkylation response protein AidB-like acyl-CoA dehydrogenase